mmetsp:Transcript_87694/g.183336  ORF Transcript_87694/g.183336 Transcript_87694/m.183336 type:complete len:323 (-) Transcript_87694:34-1002(-)
MAPKGIAGIHAAATAVWLPRLSLRASNERKAPFAASPASSSTSSTELGRNRARILCQNVWNSFFAGGPERRQRLEYLREVVDHHNVDILVVQEMFSMGVGPLADQHEEKEFSMWMEDAGLRFRSNGSFLPSFGQNSGLAIYSRFPITQDAHHTFKNRRTFSAKGWQEVTVQLGDARQMTLLNTHLEHSHKPEWGQVRRTQWEEVAERAAVHSQNGENLVAVMGDFNIGERAHWQLLSTGETEYAALNSTLTKLGCFKDLFPASKLRVETMWPEPEKPPFSPDHVFVTQPLEALVVKAEVVDSCGKAGHPVSDHRGLLVEIAW